MQVVVFSLGGNMCAQWHSGSNAPVLCKVENGTGFSEINGEMVILFPLPLPPSYTLIGKLTAMGIRLNGNTACLLFLLVLLASLLAKW